MVKERAGAREGIVEVGEIKVGDGNGPFVIAEVGINHNGDMDTAIKLINEAKCAEAGAVKLQTYITEKRVSKDSPIFGILKRCEFTFSQQEELFKYARNKGIEIFSTPFDDESVDFLASMEVPCYKIASFDIVNKKLLDKVARKKKPVIMSRGMATRDEIDEAVKIVRDSGAQVILLHCVSAYPVPSDECLNLRTINALKDRYGCLVGFSDHTIGIGAVKAAVAAGASVVEKHFTLSRKSEGPDHQLSIEPDELRGLVREAKSANAMMGEAVWSHIPVEEPILQYRRSS